MASIYYRNQRLCWEEMEYRQIYIKTRHRWRTSYFWPVTQKLINQSSTSLHLRCVSINISAIKNPYRYNIKPFIKMKSLKMLMVRPCKCQLAKNKRYNRVAQKALYIIQILSVKNRMGIAS